MLDDDKPQDNQLQIKGWEEYEKPKSSNANKSFDQADVEKNRLFAEEFKVFIEQNFIKESNDSVISKSAQIIIDAVEKLPIYFKDDYSLKLSKLKELKVQSQDSYVDFTDKYIEQFRNIAKFIAKRSKGASNCDQELEKVIKSEREREKEELKAQKEREDMDRQVAHAEWVDGNLSPKVKLISSIDESMANAPKMDLSSLAEEARKEAKKAKKFVLPSVSKGLISKVKNALSFSKKKGPQR